MCYWALALSLSCLQGERESLTKVAHLLLGLTMIFSVFWKTLSPDYLSGDFFHFSLLYDSRFSSFTKALCRLDPAQYQVNLEAIDYLKWNYKIGRDINEVLVDWNSKSYFFSKLFTYWGFVIELLIGVLFLLQFRKRPNLKHILLLLFLISIYFIAVVPTFGMLLATMGFAIASQERSVFTLPYLLVFILNTFYQIPWFQFMP